MENQHLKIMGYRELNEKEIELVNMVKQWAEKTRTTVDQVSLSEGVDPRWLAIARTDLQTGFMALIRSITKPETF